LVEPLDNIRVGTAGWQYPDWAGVFYPAPRPRGLDELAYIASYFDLVEINSSFYRIPSPATARRWVERTSQYRRFRFAAKAFHRFTHGAPAPARDEMLAFRRAIEPLYDAGKLCAVLLQFPWSFKPSAASRERIQLLAGALAPLPLAVEVRHGSWMRGEGLEYLRDTGLTVAAVDQPVIGDSIEPLAHLAGSAGVYARLHGRNYRNWFAEDAGRDARYDYLYARGELAPWVEMVSRAASSGSQVNVVLNNHFRGQAPANAFELMAMLAGDPVPAPRPLRRAHPRLEDVTIPSGDPELADGWLFDSLPGQDGDQDKQEKDAGRDLDVPR
jgi:uncharacterized protein YecE (DUF72 family)